MAWRLLGLENLEDRVVLRIDWQQHAARILDRIHQQPAGTDQRLLVGERHDGAASGRDEGRCEAGETDDRRHHPLGRPRRRLDDRLRPGRGFDGGADQRVLERPVALRIRRRRQAARAGDAPAPPTLRPNCRRPAPPRSSSRDPGRSGQPCSGRPIRSSRESSRDGDARATAPTNSSCPWPPSANDQARQRHDDENGDEPVDAIEQAAVARDQRAAVLHAGATLGGRFDQVADLARHGEAGPDRGQQKSSRPARRRNPRPHSPPPPTPCRRTGLTRSCRD